MARNASQRSHKEVYNWQIDGSANYDFTGADCPVWLIDWGRLNKPFCSVYVISPDSSWPCKIGISIAPAKRIKSLQTAAWKPLKVDYSAWCNTVQEARQIESEMHKYLDENGFWLHGEWFNLSPDKAIELIQFKALIQGIECNETVDDVPEAKEFLAEFHSEYDHATRKRLIDKRVAAQGY